MKKFIESVIAWIKSHIWQSIVIAVASVGVVTTSIVVPIALSNNNTQEPGPAPFRNSYTLNLRNSSEEKGAVEAKVNGKTVERVSPIYEHDNLMLLFTPAQGYCVDYIVIRTLGKIYFEPEQTVYSTEIIDDYANNGYVAIDVAWKAAA